MDIERIVETYSDLLLRLAIHHVKNIAEAQDVVQDVFLKYMKKQPTFDSFDHDLVKEELEYIKESSAGILNVFK